LLLAGVLLSACSSTPSVKLEESERVRLYQAKSDQLAAFSAWNMEGRLAVSNETDGGSGQFRWNSNAAGSRMDFHGALGRGAWTLEADEQGAELALADGTVHRAESIDRLIRQQVKWEIPVENLSWWVRGLATPGQFRERVIDGQGNISKLLQDGWTIEYGKYRVFEGLNLPVKLTAHQGKWKVKLAIRSWDLNETPAEHD
jgi:outer membrane lipoprotein LolB